MAVSVDQLAAEVMQEVDAAVSDLLVLPGKQDPRLVAIRRSFALAGQPALQAFQPAFGIAQVLWWINGPSIRKCCERFQTQVDAHFRTDCRRGRHIHFALNRHEEFAALGFRYGHVLRCPFDAPVLCDLRVADLRHPDAPVCDAQLDAADKEITDRLVTTFAFEVGVTGTADKEAAVGPVEVADRLLQALVIGLLEPFVAGFTLVIGKIEAEIRH